MKVNTWVIVVDKIIFKEEKEEFWEKVEWVFINIIFSK
jgi:hypothetical protein